MSNERKSQMSKERVVGVGRVSRVGERDTATIEHQEERVRAGAEREGGALVAFYPEENVSGRSPLERRTGLLPAVEMIERGEADVLSVAYFDRLCRSVRVKDEVVTRVEAAGGRVVTLDHGAVSNGSAAHWLSSTQTAAVAEYFARNVSERTMDAQRDAIEEGRPIIPRVPPGFVRTTIETAKGTRNGPLARDDETAPIMQEVFRRRANGETLAQVHAFMREQGIERSLGSLSALLRNRIYIGEVSYRDWTNPNAHKGIIDPAVFEHVQQLYVSAGRKPRSERLLSRLGILRCASCGARMSVLTTRKKRKDGTTKDYPYYYCHASNRDCAAPASIRAEELEAYVWTEFKRRYLDKEYTVTAVTDALSTAEEAVRTAKAKLAGIYALAGDVASLSRGEREVMNEAKTEAVTELHKAERAEALARRQEHGLDLPPGLTSEDADDAPLPERRLWLGQVFAGVVVRPAHVRREDVAQRVTLLGRNEAPTDSLDLIRFITDGMPAGAGEAAL
jgi:DNA invertase Pin-like site-specific DNA recombinase